MLLKWAPFLRTAWTTEGRSESEKQVATDRNRQRGRDLDPASELEAEQTAGPRPRRDTWTMPPLYAALAWPRKGEQSLRNIPTDNFKNKCDPKPLPAGIRKLFY